MTFPVWIAVPWRGRRAAVPLLLATIAVVTAVWLLRSTPMNRLPIVTPVSLFAVFLGTYSVTSILWPSRHWPSSAFDPRLLLLAWIVSGAAVVILFGPFVAVRSFLPIHPPLAIWLIGIAAPELRRHLALGATVAVTIALSGLLAAADWHWASAYPMAVEKIALKYGGSGRTVEFAGHWGWQYYAERAGFRAWDARRLDPSPGSILIVPLRADKQFIHPFIMSRARLLDRIDVPHGPLLLTTWNLSAGFRFYGGDFGQLPWGLSSEPAEEFSVFLFGPP
jgi:hypothetical protein